MDLGEPCPQTRRICHQPTNREYIKLILLNLFRTAPNLRSLHFNAEGYTEGQIILDFFQTIRDVSWLVQIEFGDTRYRHELEAIFVGARFKL